MCACVRVYVYAEPRCKFVLVELLQRSRKIKREERAIVLCLSVTQNSPCCPLTNNTRPLKKYVKDFKPYIHR